jgi:DNA-binding NtrC family response regulator
MKNARILIVDDDASVVSYLEEMLAARGYAASGATSPGEALELVSRECFDLIISDVEMPGMRGLELLKAIQRIKPDQLVLLITAFGSIELAVQAVQAGACDFVAKPFRIEVLCHAIDRAFRERRMRREIVRLRKQLPAQAPAEIVARSPAMARVVEIALRTARTGSAVLLTGESGVGKGAIARLIHDRSARRRRPFVQVNCAAVPPTLLESELFGVRRGAFTDAHADRAGLFAEANGGTLFLDEITEMPLEAQPKLLQVLETGRMRPVGGRADVSSDVRVMAATNRPLEIELRERRFRPDLYYRLNVIRIDIPPLRERREDIEPLVDLFLDRTSQRLDRPIRGISAEAMRWILAYDWPGNVRELANVIERAVALSDHDAIVPDDLTLVSSASASGDFLDGAAARGLPLEELERLYIRKVLESTGGNKVRSARILGIDRRTLHRKVTGQGGDAGTGVDREDDGRGGAAGEPPADQDRADPPVQS